LALSTKLPTRPLSIDTPPALWLNLVLPKRRVLEIYLNIGEWGPNGEFGAEAGARWAFGKSARDLNPYKAAELAAVLPNSVRRGARIPSALVRRLVSAPRKLPCTFAYQSD
jgi:monofunctional glycosyltransferase